MYVHTLPMLPCHQSLDCLSKFLRDEAQLCLVRKMHGIVCTITSTLKHELLRERCLADCSYLKGLVPHAQANVTDPTPIHVLAGNIVPLSQGGMNTAAARRNPLSLLVALGPASAGNTSSSANTAQRCNGPCPYQQVTLHSSASWFLLPSHSVQTHRAVLLTLIAIVRHIHDERNCRMP